MQVRPALACSAHILSLLVVLSSSCGTQPRRYHDDDDDGGAGGTASSTSSAGGNSQSAEGGSTGSSSSSGGAACALAEPAPTACSDACSVLYDCGNLPCDGTKSCPGFTGSISERDLFVSDCILQCSDTADLIALIDPQDCAATVAAMVQIHVDFAYVCANGI
jgi:hypothetical protein